ncbi:MAG: signal recognition particle-docking protein FtsY [Cyanobacteria bacterium J069]|nr:MAG: signal recognition particle-docking protein FtsY [Cyanobacteria bacterium J069]
MSSFNWFNRQYENQPAESDSESASEPAQDAAKSSAAEAPAESPAADAAIAQDYLTWAKSAYQNIQKRQQETANESPAVESAEITPPNLSAETPESLSSETSPADQGMSEVAIASEDTPLAAASETILPTSDSTAAVESAASLPFWAQAEAERQARLEQLAAEAAIAEETAASVNAASINAASTNTAGADIEPDDLPLDENFLWSAQVLAAQGRRSDQVDLEEITWLKRLRQGLDKTRRSLVNQLRAIVGQGPLNQDAVLEIESLLLQADVGVAATDLIIEQLQEKLRQDALPPEEAIAYLKQILRAMLDNPGGQPINPTFAPEKDTLNIWLMTGVNGAGKTTTIGKIAHIAQKSGYKTLIGAADTFRAAAVQQVKVWGDRSNVEVIANPGKNTDPAAVVFDAITAAQARGTELLLIDTAGRLQNKKNLMDELAKVRRIIDKKAPDAHIESLLVLDSTLGQNGLRQAEVFSEAAQLSGVVLTKLDGTAKGGIALAVVQQLGLPIRFIGAGEGIEDLRPFSSYEFVEALLSG